MKTFRLVLVACCIVAGGLPVSAAPAELRVFVGLADNATQGMAG